MIKILFVYLLGLFSPTIFSFTKEKLKKLGKAKDSEKKMLLD